MFHGCNDLKYCCDFFYYVHRDLELTDINVYEEFLAKNIGEDKLKKLFDLLDIDTIKENE